MRFIETQGKGSMAHSPLEKIQALDGIEKEIILCLQSAGKSVNKSLIYNNGNAKFYRSM